MTIVLSESEMADIAQGFDSVKILAKPTADDDCYGLLKSSNNIIRFTKLKQGSIMLHDKYAAVKFYGSQ